MNRLFFIALFGIILFATSCRPHKYVAEGRWLKKNKIVVDDTKVSAEELENIIKQRPNRKVLFMFYFHTWAYHQADKKPEKKWRQSLREIGEPAVVLNEDQTERSRHQMELYLRKKGYFHAKVGSSIDSLGKKKAIVNYQVEGDIPHRIGKIQFEINDTNLLKTLRKGVLSTKLMPGDNYDEEVIENERTRISNVMLNNGYYEFSKEYIYFEVDTLRKKNVADIKLVITNARKRDFSTGSDSLIRVPHNQFYIKNIFINTRYNFRFPFVSGDTIKIGSHYFLNAENLTVEPHVVFRSLFFKPGDLYQKSEVEYTYSRLSALRVFRSIRIRFENVEGEENQLNAYLDLSPASRRSLTFEGQGTHRNRALGISGNILFNNRNTFRGAESFEMRLNGGLEYQNPNSLGINSDTLNQIFNTRQAGIESSLSTPTLLLPFNRSNTPKFQDPSTKLNAAYHWQSRPGYSVYTARASFDYSWKTGDFHRFRVYPVELSYVWLRKQASFAQLINESQSRLLADSYIDHLISSTRFVYSFSNQNLGKRRNFSYLRTSAESSGNSLRAIMSNTSIDPGDDNSYELLGVRFAQYLKFDADYRIYRILSKKTEIVYRMYAGVGIPLSNLNVLPFEKSFFSGGANSIRAWNARTLGPGSVADTLQNIDNIGNLLLEANIEYRFPLYRWIKGALFLDAGNVWTSKAAGLENGDFEVNRFYKEIALAGGFGTRFDFDFFLIRLDLGVALRDPAYLEGERWLFQSREQTRLMIEDYESRNGTTVRQNFPLHLNLGIGFPF